MAILPQQYKHTAIQTPHTLHNLHLLSVAKRPIIMQTEHQVLSIYINPLGTLSISHCCTTWRLTTRWYLNDCERKDKRNSDICVNQPMTLHAIVCRHKPLRIVITSFKHLCVSVLCVYHCGLIVWIVIILNIHSPFRTTDLWFWIRSIKRTWGFLIANRSHLLVFKLNLFAIH